MKILLNLSNIRFAKLKFCSIKSNFLFDPKNMRGWLGTDGYPLLERWIFHEQMKLPLHAFLGRTLCVALKYV